ncbi:MAG: 6-phosphogluconolactonase [Gammaproteobacteria bacterium]|nr:6-phosphogluconolactonase [Gammaproteobacteria bacterium]MBU1654830.1 6-phosphogluconolactonase [Gammaproteobacteria bacterium]MBU1961097.1 6-phosphogluconolactonase [Gammaproteobacteria bacterium]
MNLSQVRRFHEFDSLAELERAAVRYILETANSSILARNAFRIVLAGGNTPRNIYRALRRADTDWPAWHVYFGDERCLPSAHPERNSQMARTAWLDHVAIPLSQIHVIPGELGPEAAAADYTRKLAEVGEFDLVLLGLGEDGHTASLFPGCGWEKVTASISAIPVEDAPKPPLRRVSLSPARLSLAHHVLFLVSGAGKREAILAWQAGADLPADRIRPHTGVEVFLNLANCAPSLAETDNR